MSCSIASHSEPRSRSSAASCLSILSPRVSPGSKSLRRKSLPFVTRNGSVYVRMASRTSLRGIDPFLPICRQTDPVGSVRPQCQLSAARRQIVWLSSKGTPFVLCQHAYERRREGKVSNGRTLALQVSPRKARFPRPKRKSSIFQHLAALCPSGHSPVLLQWGSESVRT